MHFFIGTREWAKCSFFSKVFGYVFNNLAYSNTDHYIYMVCPIIRALDAQNVLKNNQCTVILLMCLYCIMVTTMFQSGMWPSSG